jgi:hypothetical protein
VCHNRQRRVKECDVWSNEWKGYNPAFFLGAVGNGDTTMSFYVCFFFPMDHDQGWLVIACIIAYMYLALRHFILLFSNIQECFAWRKTPENNHFKTSNHYIMNVAFPSGVAMSVIVGFGAWFMH